MKNNSCIIILGPNYRKSRLKKPSQGALLELVATDVFSSDTKIDNIGNLVKLPTKENEK